VKTRREKKKLSSTPGRSRSLPLLLLVLGLVAALMAGACDDKKKRRKSRKKKETETSKVQKGYEIPEETAVAPSYIYSPVGKRDPFKSSYKVVRTKTKETTGGILTRYEIDQLKLIAIISGISRPRAQVEIPDGKGLVIKVGTRIGKNFGRVVRIKNDEVVVAEDYRDWSGRKVTNYIHMKLVKEGKKK